MNNNQNNTLKNPMPRPNTDLDFQGQLTDPFTSSEYVNIAFTDKFRDYVYVTDNQGNIILDDKGEPKIVMQKDLWAILQIFNRDWRLGNIDKKEEAVYIRHYLNLTTDILNLLGDDFKQSAMICISYSLCINETSQSKNGFVRRMLNTFIHKTTPTDDDQPKKSGFFSSFGNKNKGYN
jgi:hypothetical protein